MALHSRIKRINEEMKAILADIIMNEVKDPRLRQGLLTITNVDVTKDLSQATVWVSILGNDDETAQIMKGLEHSRGYIKRLLGERIVLKHMPNLHFRLDTTGREAAKINALLKQIEKTQAVKPPQEEKDSV